MTSPGPFVAVLITLLAVGAIIQLLVLAYRYRKGETGTRGRTIDGDVVYGDDRWHELVHDDPQDDDVDPIGAETVSCPECRTVNEATYTFCRDCTAELSPA